MKQRVTPVSLLPPSLAVQLVFYLYNQHHLTNTWSRPVAKSWTTLRHPATTTNDQPRGD